MKRTEIYALVLSMVLSFATAFLIDLYHVEYMRYMMPTAPFPTPLFFISWLILATLFMIVGLWLTRDTTKSEEVNIEVVRRLLPDLERKVLDYIIKNGGEVSQSDIARSLKLNKVRTWRVVQRLQQKGLIEVYKAKGRNIVRIKIKEN
ncbi:helix-turn-helix transcriptional regulator [Thermoproteus tenax]|uniref:Predicted membrane-associated trancriptional regulatorp n=1 Tax=Thermoproteus tenax (strain ATCC 35583 / DSM 2078 / JCM 9277 / NBRC 100435 / Kra 1) TaxID=768679 RepID=G4RNH1_THETK|nr:MarR family transcriptional regulator [Thermoproteus tenax]CCC81115.1 Predicted membrane-associated trancriptional regulatorp [Thermoproteus tenax Kra 1]